jgi:hypothetical protein
MSGTAYTGGIGDQSR